MRVLLVHPEDSPLRGPWARQRWDLIVDLGKSSRFSQVAWSDAYACAVLSADSFRRGTADARIIREILSAGRGRLLDEEGIDWWELISLLLVPELFNVLAFQRLAPEVDRTAEVWATRLDSPANAMAVLLSTPVRSFSSGRWGDLAAEASRYLKLVRRFSPAQIREIFLDKYDSGYQWRSRLISRPIRCRESVVLVPSAYENVSRVAAEYARLLPDLQFLMVATRESAKRFTAPVNVRVRDLAVYARHNGSEGEIASLADRWTKLESSLRQSLEMEVLFQTGALQFVPSHLRNSISARNAWREVLEREPVCGVLCGDDSNLFTRLPVLLAAGRKIPTADFHHGALDGRYFFKDLACDVYLAKNRMERDYLLRVCGLREGKIALAAPIPAELPDLPIADDRQRRFVVLFSEPYEAGGIRAEEFYRELLPPLLRVAHENGRELIIKLHPFESRRQREKLVRGVLGENEAGRVTIVDGPLTPTLISQAWCGVTIESTTAIDCHHYGVCCFLCGWMSLGPYEYAQQYARFGIGEVLRSVEEVGEIPSRLNRFATRIGGQSSTETGVRHVPADREALRKWLTTGCPESVTARPAS